MKRNARKAFTQLKKITALNSYLGLSFAIAPTTIRTQGKIDIHSGAKWFQRVIIRFADGTEKTWRCVPDTLFRRIQKEFNAKTI